MDQYSKHDWDNDQQWITYKNNLSGFDSSLSAPLVEKYKRRYFHQKIAELPQEFLNNYHQTPSQSSDNKTSSGSSSSSSDTSSSSSNSSSNENNTSHNSNNSNSTSSSSSVNDDSSLSSLLSINKDQLLQLSKCVALTRPGQQFLLSTVMLLTSIIGFIGVFTNRSYMMSPLGSSSWFMLCYRQALMSSIVLFGTFYFSLHSFSWESVKGLLKHSDGQYMLLCFMFLTSSSSSLSYLCMFLLIVLSLCTMCKVMVSQLIPLHIQQIHAPLGTRLRSLFRFIANKETYPQMMKMVARIEILLFVTHVLNIFVGNIQIMRTLMIFQFLSSRYANSTPFRTVCTEISTVVDHLLTHPACPTILTRYYRKVGDWLRNFMFRMQETVRQYQQQQQQQQQQPQQS